MGNKKKSKSFFTKKKMRLKIGHKFRLILDLEISRFIKPQLILYLNLT